MARKIGQAAEKVVKQERWNRWRYLIRTPKFHTEVNRLRQDYQAWVLGPPLRVGLWDGQDVVETELARKGIDLHGQPFDHREDQFLLAWGRFEHNWGVKLPPKLLTDALPALSFFTVQEWQDLWADSETIIPPAITLISAGLVDTPPGTVTIRFDLGHPPTVSVESLLVEIKKAKAVLPKANGKSVSSEKERKHHDKVSAQLRAFDKRMGGQSIEEIAESEGKEESTIKGMLAAAYEALGIKRGRQAAARNSGDDDNDSARHPAEK